MVNTDPLRLTKNKGWNKERGKKALTRTYDIQNFIIPIRSRFVVDGMFGSMLSSELQFLVRGGCCNDNRTSCNGELQCKAK